MMRLLILQKQSMDLYPNQYGCLKKQFVTVCMDSKCYTECQKHRLFNCFYLNLTVELPPADYMSGAYAFICWIRFPILLATFEVATEVLLIEADVLLYKNPFEMDLFQGRDQYGNMTGVRYECMFQNERCNSSYACEQPINGGKNDACNIDI